MSNTTLESKRVRWEELTEEKGASQETEPRDFPLIPDNSVANQKCLVLQYFDFGLDGKHNSLLTPQ